MPAPNQDQDFNLKYPLYPPPKPVVATTPPAVAQPVQTPQSPQVASWQTPPPRLETQPKAPDWFSQTPPPPPPLLPPQPKRLPPLFLYLAIIALSAVLTSAIYLISQGKLAPANLKSPWGQLENPFTPTPPISPTTQNLPTITPTSVPADAIDTSGWQIFANTAYNYQLKHPSDWTVSQWKMDKEPTTKIQNIVELKGPQDELLQVNTWLNPTQLPLFSWLEEVYQKADPTRAKIVYPAEANLTVANQSARFVSLGGTSPAMAIILSVNNKIYEIYEVNAPDSSSPLTGTYGAILKSFEVL